ncbi:MAG TPA: hypothetical protein VN673_07865 [Clostridia bacterium]|nr:hypothetical protein [Clostridia bacterium]
MTSFHYTLLAVSSLALAGCRTSPERTAESAAVIVQTWDFGKTNLSTAPAAVEKALQQFAAEGDLDGREFRIDMRRFPRGWRVEFIYLPECPDYWYTVRVLDDEAGEQKK